MNYKFKRCLEERKLEKIKLDKDMIDKEIDGADYDLERAKESFRNNDYKWATVKAYYSIFHSIKALVFKKGYREKSHYCLLIGFKTLYVDEKIIEKKFLDYFSEAMDLREAADYNLTFSEESAEEILSYAEESLEKARQLLQ
ncbi:MAG: HEPN domain-containing protein [Candidatus Woesearchaeota archaeon]